MPCNSAANFDGDLSRQNILPFPTPSYFMRPLAMADDYIKEPRVPKEARRERAAAEGMAIGNQLEQQQLMRRNCVSLPRSTRSESNSPRGKQINGSGPGITAAGKKLGPRRSQNATSSAPRPRRRDSPPERSSKYQKSQENEQKVIILQRPQSKEAAMQDLARIMGVPLSDVYAKNGMQLTQQEHSQEQRQQEAKIKHEEQPHASRNPRNEQVATKRSTSPDVVEVTKEMNATIDAVVTKNVTSQVPLTAVDPVKQDWKLFEDAVEDSKKVREDVKNVTAVKKDVTMVKKDVKKDVTTKLVVDAKKVTMLKGGATKKGATKLVTMVKKAATMVDEVVTTNVHKQMPVGRTLSDMFDERWAGPGFTNSPPPSCLPIPRFASCRSESMVTELATQGLRRILNLDV